MALALSALESGLESDFSSPPATSAACAQAWANAVQSWAAAIVPASSTVAAAASSLASSLATAFAAPAAAPGMETAFAAFAVTVGGGMVGFVPVPPPGPVGFASQFSGPKPATHHDAANELGTLIDTWMRTGTATPVAGGSPVPWS